MASDNFQQRFFILHARTAARTYITLLALVVMPFYWFTVLNLKQTLGTLAEKENWKMWEF